jgi:glutamate---cysteine ligase / carboxylate-amine ligase
VNEWGRLGEMSTRRIGVEEEFLLVDPGTGALQAVSEHAVRAHREHVDDPRRAAATSGGSVDDVEQELYLEQIETATSPSTSADGVRSELRRCRRAAAEAVKSAGAAIVAVGAPVLAEAEGRVTPKARYRRIVADYGETGQQALVCAMHVHVDVGGDDEAVGAIDRIRPWLPVLLAISANSPYSRGVDTGYASWRSQVWSRWPSAGPGDPFGDAAGYRRVADTLMEWEAAIDPGMLYFDARPSERFPTVEIRVADTCTEIDDALLVAVLARALVDTGAAQWAAGAPPAQWRTDLLRAATWRAAKVGVADRLVDPATRALAPSPAVLDSLVAHVRSALDAAGDAELVDALVESLMSGGGGAGRQRAVAGTQGDLDAVVADLRDRTESSWSAA